MTFRLTPQNALGAGCPMRSAATGQLTAAYSLAAADPVYTFTDPLPANAALSYVQVGIAMLGSCRESHAIQVRLNPNMPGREPNSATFSPATPTNYVTSCSSPSTFQTVNVYSSSVFSANVRPYVRGGENALHVEEIASGACGDVRIEYLDVTLHYYENLPRVTFSVTSATPEEERKVLMHRYRTDYGYPSPWQAALTGTEAQRDNHVLIRGTVTNADGSAYANETVFLRVLDPPDTAPYMPASAMRWYDNPYGWILFPKNVDFLTLWQTFTTNAEGKFEASLPMSWYLAGDNAVVEASAVFLPLYPHLRRGECREDDGCYRGGTFTAWRRVYLEADRMFREGGFIRADVPAGSTEIPVTNARPWRNARADNPIPITLIHSGGIGLTGFHMEQRNVIRARGGRRGVLVLDAPVSQDYYARVSSIDAREQAGDAVGRTDRGTYDQSPDVAIDLFKTAFTDYQLLPEGTKNAVPYVPHVDECPSMPYCTEIAAMWFENSQGGYAAFKNHQHLVAAARPASEGEIGHAVMGQHGGFANAAFIWTATIEEVIADSSHAQYGGLNLQRVIAETTAHELVHLYDVNPPALVSDDPATMPITGGHCNFDAWNGGHCLMNTNRTRNERGDGVVSLHVQPGFVSTIGATFDFGDSEYRRIRYRFDPLPQVFQTNRNGH